METNAIVDLVLIRKPNLTNTSIGTIVKFDRLVADKELTALNIAAAVGAFFTDLDINSIDASDPVLSVIQNLKSMELTPTQVNDNLAVLRYYNYEFDFIVRSDLSSEAALTDEAQSRGYLLNPRYMTEFSVPFVKVGQGISFANIPTYPIGIQAIANLMACPPEFNRYVPIQDNRTFFDQLKASGQLEFYDNRDSEEFMKALGYEFLLIA